MKKLLLVLNSILLFCSASFSQNALQFDASIPRYVEIGTGMNSVLAGTNKITVEAWCYPTAYPFLPTIVGNYGAGVMQFLLRIDNNRPAFWVENGTGFKVVNGATVVPLNTWTHLAGVWDGTQLRVYINGVLDGTVAVAGGAFITVATPVRIGASLTSEAFTGRIDEVRIWNVARTVTQIAAVRNNCIHGSTTNLLAYYNFEEGSGTTLTDRTGHGYNGTFVNAPTWNTGVACAITLPVNFTSIHAAYKNEQVWVDWKVGEEQAILRYVVERSADGSSFYPIGMVEANGSTAYSFQDKNPLLSGIYYRVKTAELSGASKYSPTVKVAAANSKPSMTVFPNPATGGKLMIQLLNQPAGRYTTRLLDLAGKVWINQSIQQTGTAGTFNLALPSQLAAGMYVLQVTDSNEQTESRKFYYQP